MSHVTLQFFGICTHVPAQDEEAGHQVRLVNASNRDRLWDEHRILRDSTVEAHYARLQIRNDALDGTPEPRPWLPVESEPDFPGVTVWKLDGVTLTVPGASDAPSESCTSCIPSLQDYAGEDGLPPLREIPSRTDAVLREYFACLVDLPAVTVAGKNWEAGAAVGVVRLTVPDTEPLTITATSFDGGTPLSIALKPDAVITISNFPNRATAESEKPEDFYLHFLATLRIPATVKFPPTVPPCSEPLNPDNVPVVKGSDDPRYRVYSGPGCSNSNYP